MSSCKECVKLQAVARKDQIVAYRVAYYKTHKKEIAAKWEKWKKENAGRAEEAKVKYFSRQDIKDKAKQRTQQWTIDNKERIREYLADPKVKTRRATTLHDWRRNNKERIREYKKQYETKRCAEVPGYKLRVNLRKRLSVAIRGGAKRGSAVRDLGCSIEFLKEQIEKQWLPGMTWQNWGRKGWHIDHIRPLASFDLEDRQQFLTACHYTNLQPLWWYDNLAKSDNIIPDRPVVPDQSGSVVDQQGLDSDKQR